MPGPLPGNPQHQALLQSILSAYAQDPRIRSVIVFGSLGRGNWDDHSDIDLDIIVADDCQIDPIPEVEQLCARFSALGEKAALIIPDDEDAAEIVLESLMQLSIRYHPLRTTKPAILDSMRLLAGSLDAAAIQAAGQANPEPPPPPLSQLLDEVVRYAVGLGVYVPRGSYWLSVELLHRTRALLMEVFRRTHGGQRSPQTFESQASAHLQARLKATLPGSDLHTLRQGWHMLLEILETDLAELSAGQLGLTPAQRALLARLRAANLP